MSREKNKNVLTKAEKISMTLLIILGLVSSIRGVYWITNYNTAVHKSPFYEALDRVALLYVWGVPFLLGGIFLILVSTHIINQSRRKALVIYIIVSGTISRLSFTLIVLKYINNSFNRLTPAKNIGLSLGCFTRTRIEIGSLFKKRTDIQNYIII